METETEQPNKLENDEIEIEVDDDSEDEKSSHSENGNRNGFFIQDILRPEFGSRQLKDQYYAYIQYCYSLQMHNMMLLRGAMAARNGLTSPLMSSFTHAAHNKIAPPFSPPAFSKDPRVSLPFLNHPETDPKSKDRSEVGNTDVQTPRVTEKINKIVKPQPISPRTYKPLTKSSSIQNHYNSRTCDLTESESVCKQNEQSQVSPPITNKSSTPGTNSSVNDTVEDDAPSETSLEENKDGLWPAWVYCTRYSDRPSSGPRSRKMRRKDAPPAAPEKRPRIAFTNEQLSRLKREFDENRYLTEERRASLAQELELTDAQVKIWFQNKRAKLKKTCGLRNPLAVSLMSQGLYNHSTSATD